MESAESQAKGWPAWILVAAPLASLLVYAATLDDPLHNWDDGFYIADNPRILDTRWLALAQLWSPVDAWAGRFSEFMPLRDTLYWLVHKAAGLTPWPYHLLSIVLHGACGAMVTVVGEQLGASRRAALLGGVLFIVHPVHVEAIAWVAALKDPLYTLFFLVGCWAWLRGDGPREQLIVFGALAAGLLSKALIITLAPSLLIIDVLLRRRSAGASLRRLAPLIALTMIGAWHTLHVYGQSDTLAVSYPGGSVLTGWMTTLWSLVLYLFHLFFPVSLNPRYVVAPVMGAGDARLWVALAILGTGLAVAWRTRRRHPALLFFVAFYGVGLLPVLNVVPRKFVVADHYQYQASIGLSWLVALTLTRWLSAEGSARRARLSTIAAAATSVVLLMSSWSTSLLWGDPVLLWEEVAAQEGGDELVSVHINLGAALASKGDIAAAVAHYERAIELKPEHHDTASAYANLAKYRQRGGHVDDAERLYDKAVALDPRPGTLAARAAFLEHQQRFAEAQADLEKAIHQAPRDAVRWFSLGTNAFRAGDLPRSVYALGQATTLRPALCTNAIGFANAMRAEQREQATELVDEVARLCAEGADDP